MVLIIKKSFLTVCASRHSMKYKYVTAVLLAGVLLFGGCAKQTKISNEEAYVKLNSKVKDIDFLTGRIENATLTLKDSSGK